ncbi:hypothetical protein [Anaerotignum sp.]|uniref:hypothetical protein n=1 Tax=Anaerotignum sp. TaxID=2039241 RepID=UPI00333391AF
MLGILLAILKFIGFLLFSILLLIIIMITVVLVSPLKYHLSGEKKEDIRGDFSLQWLLGLIRVNGRYISGNEPEITVKVLWFTLFKEKKEKKRKPRRKAKPVPQRMTQEGTMVAREKTSTVTKPSEGIYMAEPSSLKEEPKQSEPLKEETAPDALAKEDPLPPKPKVRRVKVADIQESPIEVPLERIEKETKDFFTGELEHNENHNSNMDKLHSYWDKFQQIEDKKEIFFAMKALLKRLIKGILPNHLSVKAVLGLGDPVYTGYLMGLVGILTAKFGKNIQVKGDFTRLVAEDIELKLKGKIVIGYFAYSLLAFICTKSVRRILIKLWKGRKKNG